MLLYLLLARFVQCLQLNIALFNVQANLRGIGIIKRLVSFPRARILRNGKTRPYERQRGFWTRPERTSARWENFVKEVVLPEEWKENFRMGHASLYKLSEELRPFIEGKVTRIRAPVDVVKHVALTLQVPC